jgi:hypothetical protein
LQTQILEKLRSILGELILEEFQHRPFYSCKDHDSNQFPGIDTKNIFLRSADYILCVIPCASKINFKALRKELGIKDITFANAAECQTFLHCEPGHLSVLGLLVTQKKVLVVLDQRLIGQKIQLHPCNNSYTWVLHTDDILQLLKNQQFDVVITSFAC